MPSHYPTPSASSSSSTHPTLPSSQPSAFVVHRGAQDAYDADSQSSDEGPLPYDASRATFTPPNHSYRHHHHTHHHHVFAHASTSNPKLTSAHPTPAQSRSPSPTPYSAFYSDEDLPIKPLLHRALRAPRPRWADSDKSSRKLRSRGRLGWKRVLSLIARSPFFPSQPASIVRSNLSYVQPYWPHLIYFTRLLASLRRHRPGRLPLDNSLPRVPTKSRQSAITLAFVLCPYSILPCRQTLEIPPSWHLHRCHEHCYGR